MAHYGSIGYRSMGTPELRETNERDESMCDHCGERAPTLDIERNHEEIEEWVCDECADAVIGYSNGGTP